MTTSAKNLKKLEKYLKFGNFCVRKILTCLSLCGDWARAGAQRFYIEAEARFTTSI
jgi:hypothetical protein